MTIYNNALKGVEPVGRKELMYLAMGYVSADNGLIKVEVYGLDGRGLDGPDEVELFFAKCEEALA